MRIATAIALALAAFSAYAANGVPRGTIVDPREEDLRIFEIVLDESVLTEALAAYASSAGGTLLPLGAVSELLGIAITTDPHEGLASGFILTERRTFHLDTGRREVTVTGKVKRYDDELVRPYSDDIYVDSALLSEWLPVAFDIDLFALRIRVRPREPLPLQTRLERERRIRHWRLGLPPPDPGYRRLRTGFRLWETPFIDQTLRLSLREKQSEANYSTYATGDLLFMESETYLAGDHEDPFDTARLTLRRRDPSGSVGGWLHATEVAVGHIIYPSSVLLAISSLPAPGVLLTNFPLHRPTEFDRHSFRGNLPPGWDVELYHNGSLIDYQPSRPDGQYVFENIPILFGMNFFRLVFYGPQGQRREEEHRFLLSESLTLPGRFEYRIVANAESEETRRASMLLSYGVSRHLTALTEVASLPTLAGERRYGKVGLRAFWSSFFTYGDYIAEENGARAWEAGLQTRIFGSNLLLSRSTLGRDFVSEAFPLLAGRLRARDRLRVDTAIPAWILPRITLSVDLERREFTSEETQTVVENRLSSNYKGLSLSNRARWTAVADKPSQLEGALQVSRYIGRVGIRGELLYTVAPTTVSTANLMLERYLGGGYRLYANVSRSFLSPAHVYSVGVDKTAGSFAAGVNTTRGADRALAANVDLSAGIGHEPRRSVWIPDARPKAPSGALSARVFLDRDYNGKFDAGDEPLPGVGFTFNGVEREQRTADTGIAYVPDLSPHQSTDVAIDARTLEDPQWVSEERGVRILLRPGKTVTLDFAVIATVEIEGTVYALRSGRREEAGGITMELVDSKGTVVQQTKTAHDGFYVLTHVRPGAYAIRAVHEGAAHLVSRAGQIARPVVVKADQSVVTGIDFELPTPAVRDEAPPIVVAERPPAPPPAPTPAERSGERDPDRMLRNSTVPSPPVYVVQLGTFSVAGNARRLAESVRDLVPDASVVADGKYHVVRTAPRSRPEAVVLLRRLAARGVRAMVVPSPAAVVAPAPVMAAVRGRGPFVVQLGAFSVARNAIELVRRVVQRGAAHRATIDRRGNLYFVETGPFATREAAVSAREELERAGIEGIVRPVASPGE